MIHRVLIFLLLFLALGNSLSAQDEPLKLTPADVSRFIESYPKIKADFGSLGIKYNDADHSFTLPDGFHAMSDINGIVAKHGYTDFADYITKAGLILTTYAAIRLKQESVPLQPELEEAIREIRNSPHYTAEQKEQMIEAIRKGAEALGSMVQSVEDSNNVQVVKPYTEAIEKVLEEN